MPLDQVGGLMFKSWAPSSPGRVGVERFDGCFLQACSCRALTNSNPTNQPNQVCTAVGLCPGAAPAHRRLLAEVLGAPWLRASTILESGGSCWVAGWLVLVGLGG
jgi:hypothetical protein